MKSRMDIANLMDRVFRACRDARSEGQKEYAHNEDNGLANFERVAERLGIDRKKVLMTYAEKHLDGIHAHNNGLISQRESVRGRIRDVIVYMVLLWAMVDDDDSAADKKDGLPF